MKIAMIGHKRIPSREGGVEMLGGAQGEFHAPAAGLDHGLELAGPDFYQGKFGRDEKAVGGDQRDDDEEFE